MSEIQDKNQRGNLLITNLHLIATPLGKEAKTGEEMDQIHRIPHGALAVENGMIQAVGPREEVERKFSHLPKLDGQGATALPGFVDPHTHLVFVGSREKEFEMRIRGKTYVEIAQEGGGILHSVRALRKASLEEVVHASLVRAERLLQHGVTTVEVKSGYGLNLDDELKQLQAVKRLNAAHVLDFVPTFLGAHEVPPEYRGKKSDYIQLLCSEIIPAVAEKKLAEFCDIFCEAHVFNVDESRQVLLRARECGLRPKLHADEIEPLGGAELSAEVGAISADHLGAISDRGMDDMARKGVIAVLLPGTSFYLSLKNYAPAREMIRRGVAVALATDLNPGSSMTESMAMILTLACLYLKLTPREALTAVTLNSACAIDRGHDRGSLEVGKLGDVVLWDIPHPEYLPYHYGVNLVSQVIKRGVVVYSRAGTHANYTLPS